MPTTTGSAALSPAPVPAVPVERLLDVAETAAGMDGTWRLFADMEALTRDLVGHRLFSISAYFPSEFALQRVYSSDEGAYPVGGRKLKRGTAWADQVLQRGEAFIGQSGDIRQAFDDHDRIAGLGLGSIINIPVRWGGKTLGTMNLLDREGKYAADHLRMATALGQLLLPALLLRPAPQ